jgi:long-chain fatty acid transport protein
MSRFVPIVLVSLCFISSVSWAQRGAEAIGFDPPQTARAGVDVAIAEDISAILTNPAGLVQIKGPWRVDLSLRGGYTRGYFEDALNPEGLPDNKFAMGPSFGVAWDPEPGGEGLVGDYRFALGLYHTAAFNVKQDLFTIDFPAPEGTTRESDFIYTGLHLGWGYQISEKVSVGASLSLSYSTLTANKPLELPTSKFQGLSPLGVSWGQLFSNNLGIDFVRVGGGIETEATWGLTATLGLLWDISETVTLGLSYRTESYREDYEFQANLDFSTLFPQPDPNMFPDGYDVSYDGTIRGFSYPQEFAIGLAWMARDDLRLSTEFRWINWSATHDRIRVELENGSNGGFNAFMGSTSLEIEDKLLWTDMVSIGVSFDWWFTDGWVLRGGFSANNSPIEPDESNPIAPAYMQLHAGLGLGYAAEDWALEFAWLHSFKESFEIGTSLISQDLDNTSHSFAVDSFLIGLTYYF